MHSRYWSQVLFTIEIEIIILRVLSCLISISMVNNKSARLNGYEYFRADMPFTQSLPLSLILVTVGLLTQIMYTRRQNVWSGWPVYEVKCLCSRGQE